ncbi:MAG TPA: protein-glutamate O-methyltransferase CheR [Spirochaetia bacterium]|nr:protein-glutamate O-methyltransferase CheR [Spirochaetia bacterium]
MDFAAFKAGIKENFALDLDSYKEGQLRRRLDSFMARQKTDYGTYFRKLIANRIGFKDFVEFLTINVSEFFRDSNLFLLLQKEVLPGLLTGRRNLRIWSAACANGAEPYSLAILLDEMAPGRRHTILATDIDQQVLLTAEQAIYARESLKNVSPQRLNRYFAVEGDGRYRLVDQLRTRVEFRQHNLLKDPCERDFDLIACRNVLIYFTREAQNGLFEKFGRSLVQGGVVFIGGSEMIFRYAEMGFEKLYPCFYRRLGDQQIQTGK